MKLSLFIAKRYLFSKKKQNAINIISVISVVGVAIGTSALVIILSVFNGIDLLLQKSADSFTPDLVISPLTGKFSHFDDSLYQVLRNNSSVAYYNQIVEEKALVKYDDKLSPVTIKGVADDYARNTHFEDNIIQGTFQLKTGDTYKSVVGYGLAAELGIGLNFLTPMVFYYPDKNAGVSASALNTAYLYPSAFFSSQQEIEGQYVLTDLEFAQRLFGINDQISKIEIKLKDSKLIPEVKKELSDFTDTTYRLEDKYELNKAFYAMMKSEKLAVFMILLFILLIASFNIIGSISMLILDRYLQSSGNDKSKNHFRIQNRRKSYHNGRRSHWTRLWDAHLSVTGKIWIDHTRRRELYHHGLSGQNCFRRYFTHRACRLIDRLYSLLFPGKISGE